MHQNIWFSNILFYFVILGCCFSICNLASLRLEVDGANRGCRTLRLESNLSEMDHLIKVALDPLEFMCQAVGVNPACKDKLDEALAKQFRNNMPQNGGLHLLKGEINSESTTLSGNDGAKGKKFMLLGLYIIGYKTGKYWFEIAAFFN